MERITISGVLSRLYAAPDLSKSQDAFAAGWRSAIEAVAGGLDLIFKDGRFIPRVPDKEIRHLRENQKTKYLGIVDLVEKAYISGYKTEAKNAASLISQAFSDGIPLAEASRLFIKEKKLLDSIGMYGSDKGTD